MHTIKIAVNEDEHVVVEGSINKKFPWYLSVDDGPTYLAVSDGTLLKIDMDFADKIWRFDCPSLGGATLFKVSGLTALDTSDTVTLTSETPFAWVVMGEHLAIGQVQQ